MEGQLATLLAELGIELTPEQLGLAFIHRSYAYENGGLATNERLEFLGDAVLGVVVTEHLYLTHPDLSEGQLARLRAAVVNARALAGVARNLGLGSQLKLGKGEEATGGRDKTSILADTTEAVIGAIHLGAGADAAARFVRRLFDPLTDRAATLGAGLDWKTSLQEQASLAGLTVPHYVVTAEGPDHAKKFEAVVHIGDHVFGPGAGTNKKQAEQQAAQLAFEEVRAMAARITAARTPSSPPEPMAGNGVAPSTNGARPPGNEVAASGDEATA
ncbi:ribonuclease III [Propionibacteriaceae bacterium Y2011]|uniref:ribonuclease III n=1 Tax=Microlunatus sp. Y2014 TaxID=3418488 RepID=UPI003B4E3EF0